MATGSETESRAVTDTGVDVWRLEVSLRAASTEPSVIPASTTYGGRPGSEPGESCESSVIMVSTSNDVECARDPRDVTDTGVDVRRY